MSEGSIPQIVVTPQPVVSGQLYSPGYSDAGLEHYPATHTVVHHETGSWTESPYTPQPYGYSPSSSDWVGAPEATMASGGYYDPYSERPAKQCGSVGILSNPFQCPILIYTFLVVLGMIINLFLLGRTPDTNKVGQPVSDDLKWSTAALGIGFTVVMALIFGAWIYYLCINCDYIEAWIVFLLALLFPVLLTYFAALIMGEWLGMGHLWDIESIPLQPAN